MHSNPDVEHALDNIEDELVGLGEFDAVDRYDDKVVVKMHARTMEDFEYLDSVVYDTAATESVLTTDETTIENKHAVGTDARGNQRIPGKKYTIRAADD